MPRNLSLRPRRLPSLGNEALQWIINVPASLSPTGKRQRRFFATREQAEVECELLKTRKFNFGHSLLMMSPQRIAEARACYQRLELECPEATLPQAVEEFIKLHRNRTSSVPLRTLFDSVLAAKGDTDRDYQRKLREAFNRFADLDGVLVSELDPQRIERVLKGLSAGNRNTQMRYLRLAFNYGKKRGWLAENPINRLEFKKVVRDEVEIFAPAIVEKLLFDALSNELSIIPYLVFSFFCGIRPQNEIQKVLWSDIDLTAKEHHVTIRPTVAKKRRKRWIDLSANALAWVDEYRARDGKIDGRIIPFSWSTLRRKRDRLACRVGLDAWPQDGTRHTWASAWLRQHGDINKLVLQAGHDSPTTMWNHYYQAMTPQDATAFWAIYPPEREERRIVAFQT
jgi:integrase